MPPPMSSSHALLPAPHRTCGAIAGETVAVRAQVATDSELVLVASRSLPLDASHVRGRRVCLAAGIVAVSFEGPEVVRPMALLWMSWLDGAIVSARLSMGCGHFSPLCGLLGRMHHAKCVCVCVL